jgi:DNA-binding transcriptional MerR regulator
VSDARERLLEVSQVARILGVSPSTVRRMAEAELLEWERVGAGDRRTHRRIHERSLRSVNPLPEEGVEDAIRDEEIRQAGR